MLTRNALPPNSGIIITIHYTLAIQHATEISCTNRLCHRRRRSDKPSSRYLEPPDRIEAPSSATPPKICLISSTPVTLCLSGRLSAGNSTTSKSTPIVRRLAYFIRRLGSALTGYSPDMDTSHLSGRVRWQTCFCQFYCSSFCTDLVRYVACVWRYVEDPVQRVKRTCTLYDCG